MDKDELVCMPNGKLLNHKNNELMTFGATWIDLEVITLSKVIETENDKSHMISLTWGIYNMTQMNLSMKQKQIYR